MKNIIKKIKDNISSWWRRNIVDYCPPELEDEEFSEKYR
jgi:hypothetical protein